MKEKRALQQQPDKPGTVLGSGAPSSLDRADLADEIDRPLSVIITRLDEMVERFQSSGSDLRACIHDVQRPLEEARHAAQRIRVVVRHMVASLQPIEGESLPATRRPRGVTARVEALARILVVDDEIVLGNALRRSLREYDVVALASARDALERISAGERFAFILCDVMMPELTGVDFYDEVLRLAPDQAGRIVFMTGGATTPRAEHFLSTTANAVLEKPFPPQRVRDLIRERLDEIRRAAGTQE